MRKQDLKVGMVVRFKEELRHVEYWDDDTNCGDCRVGDEHDVLYEHDWKVVRITAYGNAEFEGDDDYVYSPDWFDPVSLVLRSKADLEALYD